jgi:N utilization substance protein A
VNTELKAIFDYLSRERGLDRATLVDVMRDALQMAGRKACGGRDVRVEIDPVTFNIRAFVPRKVVDFVRNRQTEVSLAEAQRSNPAAQLGDSLENEVNPASFGRIAIQNFRQIITQRLRGIEREKVYNAYRAHLGGIITGTVRRFERGDVVVDLGDTEGLMPMRERVSSEEYAPGDRLRFLLVSMNDDRQGSSQGSLILSRSSPQFIRELFKLEVAEIADGTVKIEGIAREAGYRTKIAVHSEDDKVDPVGACVGLRGQRVKNIVRELSGEKVDIVRWSDDIKTFVTNALAPAKLLRLTVDEAAHTVRAIVENDQLSLAIGKKGQNARLTAKLTGWKIDVHRDESELSFEEQVAQAKAQLVAALRIPDAYAEALVASGFSTLDGIRSATVEDLVDVEGIDAEAAAKIHAAALASGAEEEPQA